MPKVDTALLDKLDAWYDDPVLFVREALNAEPEPWQADALNIIGGKHPESQFVLATNSHRRLAVRSGHGVGKTTLLCWAILWFMCTRKPCKVPVTANSQDQLRDVVWADLKLWLSRLPGGIRNQFDASTERLWLKAAPEEVYAVARTASKENTESLQGFHSKNVLFVAEEASGIDEVVFDVVLGALSTQNAIMLLAGNPTRGSGFFFDVFHRLREDWSLMRVSSADVERATGHIKDIATRYGSDSNQYRVRVEGEFPKEDDDVVIPLHLVEAALTRNVEKIDDFRVVWGLDVALFGDDRCALAKRQGNVLLEPVTHWRNLDLMQTAGRVKQLWDDCEPEEKPSEILVDEIGLGAGVRSRLQEIGLPVRGINVAERPSNRQQYMRLRDELWFMARNWFDQRNCVIPDDGELIAELCDIRYAPTSNGKLKVESKAEMKERLRKSPDLADAFVLTFAGGLERRAEHVGERFRSKRTTRHTAWAA